MRFELKSFIFVFTQGCLRLISGHLLNYAIHPQAGRTVGIRRGAERDPLESLLLGFGWVGSCRASVPARVGACVIPKCYVRATLFVQCVMSGLALCAAFL